MNLYKNLSHIYHQMYQNLFDYEAEFRFYDIIMAKENCRSVMEFGCGTGNLAKRFVDKNYEYHGIDLSCQMLEIAKQTLPETVFFEGDLRTFKTKKIADAVLMTGRTISYLTSNKDVLDSFETINKCLKINGLLVFDAIDASLLFENFDLEKKELIVNNYKRLSRSSFNLETGWTWNWNSEYFELDNENYKKIGEDFAILRAFTKDEIRLFLKISGFELIEIIEKETYTWRDNYFTAKKVAVP